MGLLAEIISFGGIALEICAIVHYFRRRPEMFWIYVIFFLGPLGAAIYLGVVALPEMGIFQASLRGIPRRKRVVALEAMVEDNPSAANYEELGDLYMDAGQFAEARAAFDKVIAARSATTDSFYRRALCTIQLGNAAAALADLEQVVREDPAHDFHRAAGLLAHACAQSGQKERADALFLDAINRSTLSETYLNFAKFLASEGRTAEAREWAQKVLNKERNMPAYLRRREQRWFQNANEMLKNLPA